MKITIQKLALLIAMLIAVLPAAATIGDTFAYDRLNFAIIKDAHEDVPGKVIVTSNQDRSISGDIVIPANVPYNEQVYLVTEIGGSVTYSMGKVCGVRE